MTIYEVLKQNIQILENLRIPVSEREIWGAVQAVLNNERACVEVMEQQEKEQEKQTENASETKEVEAE